MSDEQNLTGETPPAKAKPRRKGKHRKTAKLIRTPANYAKALEIWQRYRGQTGGDAAVGRALGWGYQTVKGLWTKGWPYEWAPPARSALAEQSVLTRAMLAIGDVAATGSLDSGADLRRAGEATLDGLPMHALGAIEAQQAVEQAAGELRVSGVADAVDREQVKALRARAAVLVADAQERDAASLKAARERMEDAERIYTDTVAKAEADAKQRYQTLIDASKLDAAQTAADEALMSRMSRRVAVAALGMTVQLYGNVKSLTDKLLDKAAVDKMTSSEAIDFMRTLSAIANSANRTARHALEIERTRVGDAAGINSKDDRDSVPVHEVEEKARQVMAAAARVRERAAQRGLSLVPPPTPPATGTEGK